MLRFKFELAIYKRTIYQGQSYTPQTVPTPHIASSLQVDIKASVEDPLILTAADRYNGNGASQGTSGGQNIGAAMKIDNNKKFSLLTGAYLDGITGGWYSFASMKARMFAERG